MDEIIKIEEREGIKTVVCQRGLDFILKAVK